MSLHNDLIYSKERLAIAFGFQKHPERKAYYKVIMPALELAYIANDWPWYIEIKEQAWRKQTRIEEARLRMEKARLSQE